MSIPLGLSLPAIIFLIYTLLNLGFAQDIPPHLVGDEYVVLNMVGAVFSFTSLVWGIIALIRAPRMIAVIGVVVAIIGLAGELFLLLIFHAAPVMF